ncbi:CIS tube protein [Massilia endophytica]|uniref:CIS tube protein n=1 Tax=Massilia endophytica TaxID=2899220 RepID=UPI001E53E668|nr:peptidoglycan-binding protein [Massilia endophytica]UGQ48174.1 peptidoglycan-binding protein [Massilia endophytica]
MTLKKLTIIAYADPGFSQKVGDYSVQINPESYRQTHSTQYTDNDSTDTAGVTTKFYVQDPQKLTFDFYLDATGVVQPSITSVATEISNFKTVAYSYNGTIHAPNYLEIVWGNGVSFNCRLTSLDIDYTLFQSDGTPVRAKLSVGFEEYLSPQEIAQRANKSSPDLTHARVVQGGDTLPNMCFQIYGDPKHYPGVAAYNELDNFRALQSGMVLYFPPLAQT